MAIVAPIAGAYTSTYDSLPMAYTRQGYNLNFSQKGERIEESDLYGNCLLDIIYRGAQMSIDAVFRVYSDAVVNAIWPWASSFGSVYSAAYPVSQLASDAGGTFVLTAVLGTPAALGPGPNTLTTDPTILAPDQNTQLIFSSVCRDVPIRFDVLLSDNSGTGSLFVAT